jgi:hypothetical protein
MKPIYIKDFCKNIYLTDQEIFNHLMNDLIWLEATPARKEYFMSNDGGIEYTYGSGVTARTYTSSFYSDKIKIIRNKLDSDYNCNYNVCFLNRYDNAKNWLGWHSDDSPEMNPNHDIAVVSFGAPREIWWKDKEYKGVVPLENRQLLASGSLFVMPAGFQSTHYHKIPKSDKECGTRISLTFRNYKKL